MEEEAIVGWRMDLTMKKTGKVVSDMPLQCKILATHQIFSAESDDESYYFNITKRNVELRGERPYI